MKMARTMIFSLIILLAISIYIKHHIEASWETFKLENSCYVTAVKEGERNVPHAVGLGIIMQKGPDMECWDCNGQIIWREVEYRQRPS
jgi:hypothetical protein